jgi:hypothetical protein
MEKMGLVLNALEGLANLFSIAASALALYLFFVKRSEIAAAFRLLLSFSFQTSLAELKEKLERLNEYNANEPTHVPEIRNILQTGPGHS